MSNLDPQFLNVIFHNYFKPPVTYSKVQSTIRSSNFSKIVVELLKNCNKSSENCDKRLNVSLSHHCPNTMIRYEEINIV